MYYFTFDLTNAVDYIKNLDDYSLVDSEKIKQILEKHMEEQIENWIENINDYPEDYLKEDYKFWKKIDKAALEAERNQAA